MKKIHLFLLTASLLATTALTAQEVSKVVRLSGSMKALRVPQKEMVAENIATNITPTNVATLKADAEGNYQVELNIDRPGYYNIAHTRLYLTPGAEMTVQLGMMPQRSTFSGPSEELARYLNQPIPSIWELFQKALPESFEAAVHKTDSALNTRSAALKKLKPQTDPSFYEMESIRLKANQVNMYLSYFSFSKLSQWDDTKEVKLEKKKTFYRTITSVVEPLLQELTASDHYLELAEVREALKECYETEVFRFAQSPTFLEWMKATENCTLLDTKGLSQQEYNQMTDFGQNIKNTAIRQAFLSKLQRKEKLVEGRPAIDLELEDFDGNKLKLSDLKGRPLFLDFWATWCLPCLAQKPKFEELSAEYPDIQFIGISIDMDPKSWRAKLQKSESKADVKEYLANPYAAGEAWDIQSIPRFILIDKDFNIVSGTAPRPTDSENIRPLLEKLSGDKE